MGYRCSASGARLFYRPWTFNNRDMSDYSDAVHPVFHGRIVAYIEATGTAGPVRVRFTAAGLPAADLTLSVR